MFVKVKADDSAIYMVNINSIDNVCDNNGEYIKIETNSRYLNVKGSLESFTKTLSDIMKTKQIMWYRPQETK